MLGRLIPYRSIEQSEHIDTAISTDMTTALDLWYDLYLNKAPWLETDKVRSLNLPAFVSAEMARQIVLEMKWNITGKSSGDPNKGAVMNPRAEYLAQEFEKLTFVLRQKLEQGCAAGGMIIKPYPNLDDGHIYFDWTMDWNFYPIAFDDSGNLCDVILPDSYTEGKTFYTRLERHTLSKDGLKITQRAFKSNMKDSLGVEISLSEVDRWSTLQPEATVKGIRDPLFGWFKVAAANNIDVDSPMGASVFAKAVDIIKEADIQYSRLLWEYEGSELAVDVDPTVLRPKKVQTEDGATKLEMPKLNERLFRGLDMGTDELYRVFSPQIRDGNLLHGLNQLYIRVEDLCGLSRGTISDANVDARTATELMIIKQRSYATVSDNQRALEQCLKAVIKAMDTYATTYKLAPEGEYEVSFEWDDSILVDSFQEMNEKMTLLNLGVMGTSEFRQWYFGETPAQAQAAVQAIRKEQLTGMEELLPQLKSGGAQQAVAQMTKTKFTAGGPQKSKK